MVCDIRPLKSEIYHVRLTVRGDRLVYAGDPYLPAVSSIETKLLLNSIISDAAKGARFLSLDLKDFFLATPMDKRKYMKLKASIIPADIKQQYNLGNLEKDGFLYVKIKRACTV